MTVGTGKLFSSPPILIEGVTEFEEHLSICMEPRCLVEFRDINLLNKEHDLVQYGIEILATRQRGELDCGFQFNTGSEASIDCISQFVESLRSLVDVKRKSAEFCDMYGFALRIEKCKPSILQSKFILTTNSGYPCADYEMSVWRRPDFAYAARVEMSCLVDVDEIRKLVDSMSSLLQHCRSIQSP